ncbi:hypothetical protein ACN47E_001349 [Coniothyrium glycines]
MITAPQKSFAYATVNTTSLPVTEQIKSPWLANYRKSFTRSKASVAASKTFTSTSHSPPHSLRTSPRKKRKPDFNIFCETSSTTEISRLSYKRSKTAPDRDLRVPLVDRSDFANSTPTPSPRMPSAPFVFSTADPCWENIENYDPQSDLDVSFLEDEVAYTASSTLDPPPTRPSIRVSGSRKITASQRLPPPVDMEMYHLLGITSWKVTRAEIRTAYRKIAFAAHPDKVGVEQRNFATIRMQQVNAAKDLLLDNQRRWQYHTNGYTM